MSHAAEGLLQAYMDGEVSGSAATELEAHLAVCAECAAERQRLRADNDMVAGALGLLDRPLSEPAVQQAYWRARGAARSRRFGAAALARAAGVLLLVGSGVMAVVPGSPLRRAAQSLLDSGREPVSAPATAPAAAPAAAPAEADLPGVTMVPREGRVQVRVWSVQAPATIRVNLVDGVRVSVQAGAEAGDVSFRSSAGWIQVTNLGAGTMLIEIPRSLPFASLEVDGRQWLFKDGDSLRLNGPVVEQAKDRVVFRAGN